MPTLNIGGRRVKVGDEFLLLSPKQQNATVDEIAASFGETPAAPAAPEMPEAPVGMELDPVTGQMFDPALRQAGIDRHADSPVVGALKRTGVVADNFVRGAADMATFGTADEIAAGLTPGNYDANLAAERERDANGGAARMAGQVAGALALPGAAAKTTLGAVRNGAIAGAAYGFGSGEGGFSQRAANATIGAVTGGATSGAVRGVTNALGNRAAKASIPTTEQIGKAASAAYKEADNLGIIVRPESGKRLADAVKADLADFGYDTTLHPGIGAVLSRLDNLGAEATTLKGVDIVRRVARAAGKDFTKPGQQELSGRIIEHIDDFLGNLSPGDVLAGNAKEAANAMLKGRSLWARMRKAEFVDDAVDRATNNASTSGTGGNIDNALRQQIKPILNNPKVGAGFTKAEKAAAKRIVRGTVGQNTLRLAGRLSPRGNGLMAALGGGSIVANPAIAVPAMAAADVAKRLADKATPKNVERLSQIIRSGGLSAPEIRKLAEEGVGTRELLAAVARYRNLEKKTSTAASALAASVLDGTLLKSRP